MVKKFMKEWYCVYPILPAIYSVLAYCIMRILNLTVQRLWEFEVIVIGKKAQIMCLAVITLAAYYIIYYLCKRTIKSMKMDYKIVEGSLKCTLETVILLFASQSCLYYTATYFEPEIVKEWAWIMVIMCILVCMEWVTLSCFFLYDKLGKKEEVRK